MEPNSFRINLGSIPYHTYRILPNGSLMPYTPPPRPTEQEQVTDRLIEAALEGMSSFPEVNQALADIVKIR